MDDATTFAPSYAPTSTYLGTYGSTDVALAHAPKYAPTGPTTTSTFLPTVVVNRSRGNQFLHDPGVPDCPYCADHVTDVPCGWDKPCAASVEGAPRFCDYQLGPDASGYCAACGAGWAGSLSASGADDWAEKCACPWGCGAKHFCSGKPDRGCLGCREEGIEHPSACKGRGYSWAAYQGCNVKCFPPEEENQFLHDPGVNQFLHDPQPNVPDCPYCADDVTDVPCGRDKPCAASGEGAPRFCDYQLGPDAGGYCAVCHAGWAGSLSALGADDWAEKCACPWECGAGGFCSGKPDRGCVGCREEGIKHPSACEGRGYSKAALRECNEKCSPMACRQSFDCGYSAGNRDENFRQDLLGVSEDLSDNGVDENENEGRRLAAADYAFFCNFGEPDDVGSGDEPTGTCAPCAGLLSTDECVTRGTFPLGSQECVDVCKDVMPNSCDTNEDCIGFCNDRSHACEDCPDRFPWGHCGNSDLDDASLENCIASCQNTLCVDTAQGSVVVGSLMEVGGESTVSMIDASYIVVSEQVSVSGPLVECRSREEGTCPADAPNSFVCFFSNLDCDILSTCSPLLAMCKESGGIAMVYYPSGTYPPQGGAHVLTRDEPIPAVRISNHDGQELLKNGLGLEVKIADWVQEECIVGCSDRVPCPSSPEAMYCDFNHGDHGTCRMCRPDEDEDAQTQECFFSGLPLEAARDCAQTCNRTLAAASCKFCGERISADSLQSAQEGEVVCNFCPDGLKQSNNDLFIPFLGSDTTCFKMNQFFRSYKIAENNPNCKLAVNFNYICSCDGPSYAGADSTTKKRALVWVPRTSAILSFFGSLAIVVDILRDSSKRAKMRGKLLVMMSIFDIVGSVAYALTSLPIPEEYGIEGSRGNDATCLIQGFLLQIGTIAALFNASLATYFFLGIHLDWSDSKINDVRHWLFICPIFVGLIFACVGFLFYGMMLTWCNNTDRWWPEIPVIVAILVTTILYLIMFWGIYTTEQAMNVYAHAGGQGQTKAVFWQFCYYLVPFYLTWVPYLALQYLWASGSGYSNFGFVMAACTLVPLQGLWNSLVYFRKRARAKIQQFVSRISSWLWSTQNNEVP